MLIKSQIKSYRVVPVVVVRVCLIYLHACQVSKRLWFKNITSHWT